MSDQTTKIKRRYNRIAKVYDSVYGKMERIMLHKWRKLVWGKVNGRVLEIGVGTGNNIEHYPENVEVTAIDFSENMIERARQKANKLGKAVDLRIMDVQQLEFADETFDTVVTTCVFCSVPNPVKGLEEIRRVCKKDGQILMLEHVRSKRPVLGTIMDLLNPVTVLIQGVNINRDTVNNLNKAGLHVNIEQNLVLDILKYLESRP